MGKTNLIVVKGPPNLKNPEIVSGFRDKASVKIWAEARGYATVYYLEKKQRVYVEKMLVRVDEVAQGIERQSIDLLTVAEAGLNIRHAV